jgi:hypothetical protein
MKPDPNRTDQGMRDKQKVLEPARRKRIGRITACVLLAVLGLLAAVLTPSARADYVVVNDHFDWTTNFYITVSNGGTAAGTMPNPIGIGNGWLYGLWNWGSIIVTNDGTTGSKMVVRGRWDGSGVVSITSSNAVNLTGRSVKYEFNNVFFNWDFTSETNNAGHRDIVMLGLQPTPGGGNHQNSPTNGGVYLQFMSDSLVNDNGGATTLGQGGFNGTNCLFAIDGSGNRYVLARFQFDHLDWSKLWEWSAASNTWVRNSWGTRVASASTWPTNWNWNPVLGITMILSNSSWSLQITGDTMNGGSPINLSGTYPSGFTPPRATYAHFYTQNENPGTSINIDQIIGTFYGDLDVGAATYTLPDYSYWTNQVFAGDNVKLSCTNINSVNGVASVKWQQESSPGSGTYVDIPGATSNTWTFNTLYPVDLSGGFAAPNRFQMVVTDTHSLSATSAVATIIVNVIQPPTTSLGYDLIPSGAIARYPGEQVTFRAALGGALPIGYRWESSLNTFDWVPVPGVGNTNQLVLKNLSSSDSRYYRLAATNICGQDWGIYSSSATYLGVIPDEGKQITWSDPVKFAGLTADQILGTPTGYIMGGAEANDAGRQVVSLGNGTPVAFTYQTWSWVANPGTRNTGARNNAFDTGNANLNTVLDGYDNNAGPKQILLSNLVVGQQYSVQLFGCDNRTTITPTADLRLVNYQSPGDDADVSGTFTMSDNMYVIGTFTATNNYQMIQENLLWSIATAGNYNAAVLRALSFYPPIYSVATPGNRSGYLGYSATFTTPLPGAPTAAADLFGSDPWQPLGLSWVFSHLHYPVAGRPYGGDQYLAGGSCGGAVYQPRVWREVFRRQRHGAADQQPDDRRHQCCLRG